MFFDARSFPEQKLSLDHFKEWGNSIASSYISTGEDPTQQLVKIAEAEELTPDQIRLLAGETNKLIHQEKYGSAPADGKYHAANFPLADADQALKLLQVDGGEKVACVMPDPVFSDQRPDAYAMFGVKADGIDKTAAERAPELKHELKLKMGKVAHLKQRTGDEIYMKKVACLSAERAFIKEARQVALAGQNGPERMACLGTVFQMAKEAGFEDDARPALAKLAYVLMKEGLVEPGVGRQVQAFFQTEKTADVKAPESLISGFLPQRVVNGTHPLYITLKTFHDHKHALNLQNERYQVIDDRLKIMGQKIREL